MKKILLNIGISLVGIIVLVFAYWTITLVSDNSRSTMKRQDFATTLTNGIVDYSSSLKNHDWVEVDSEDGHTTMMCSNILSLRVVLGGTLEIIDDDGKVYLISDNWQLEFYDYIANE